MLLVADTADVAFDSYDTPLMLSFFDAATPRDYASFSMLIAIYFLSP